jgi:hypothetical protein
MNLWHYNLTDYFAFTIISLFIVFFIIIIVGMAHAVYSDILDSMERRRYIKQRNEEGK